jgi:phenylacetate-CoA ligase
VFETYGLAERVAFSSECDRHEGQHLFEEYGVTEFVDDQGEPVATGAPGRLTGTSLHNFAMPLIRYVTGDVATPWDRVCACGRTAGLLLAYRDVCVCGLQWRSRHSCFSA